MARKNTTIEINWDDEFDTLEFLLTCTSIAIEYENLTVTSVDGMGETMHGAIGSLGSNVNIITIDV